MSEMEKKLVDSLAKAAAALPESKREFLLGYAEGVAAMTEAKEPAAPAPTTAKPADAPAAAPAAKPAASGAASASTGSTA